MSWGKTNIKVGDVFGQLTVTEELGKIKPNVSNHLYYKCRCSCGNETITRGTMLKNGKSRKCKKCSSRENLGSDLEYKHGMTNTRMFHIWQGIIARCNNTNHKYYKDYGGRGIRVCDEWEDGFIAFYNWSMANGYTEELTIDRINNDGNYTPDNCRWTDKVTQANNTRGNRQIEYKGETHTIAEWGRITGIKAYNIDNRLNKYGWSVEQALSTPINKK